MPEIKQVKIDELKFEAIMHNNNDIHDMFFGGEPFVPIKPKDDFPIIPYIELAKTDIENFAKFQINIKTQSEKQLQVLYESLNNIITTQILSCAIDNVADRNHDDDDLSDEEIDKEIEIIKNNIDNYPKLNVLNSKKNIINELLSNKSYKSDKPSKLNKISLEDYIKNYVDLNIINNIRTFSLKLYFNNITKRNDKLYFISYYSNNNIYYFYSLDCVNFKLISKKFKSIYKDKNTTLENLNKSKLFKLSLKSYLISATKLGFKNVKKEIFETKHELICTEINVNTPIKKTGEKYDIFSILYKNRTYKFLKDDVDIKTSFDFEKQIKGYTIPKDKLINKGDCVILKKGANNNYPIKSKGKVIDILYTGRVPFYKVEMKNNNVIIVKYRKLKKND